MLLKPLPKSIYLTIDDFPSATSGELLEYLVKQEIPAVLFGIGKKIKSHPELARAAVRKGFILANHSYSHPHFSRISMRRAKREILKTDKLINSVYEAAGIDREYRYFRFPYGDKGDGRLGKVLSQGGQSRQRLFKIKLQQFLSGLGYQKFNPPGIKYRYYHHYLGREYDLHWTLDSMDWQLKNQPEDFKFLLGRLYGLCPADLRGEPNETAYGLPFRGSDEILLVHDDPVTLPFVQLLLSDLKNNKNYNFKTLAGNQLAV